MGFIDLITLKDGGAEVSHLMNMDIKPVPVHTRIWRIWDYCSFFSVINISVGTWSAAASLLNLGFNVGETMGVILVANVFVSTFYLLVAAPGYDYHIGFTVFQRVIFGVRGYYLSVLLRIGLAIVSWAGTCWIGGLMVNTILSSWSKHYLLLENTFPASVPMNSRDLIGYVIFQIIQIPFLFYKPEHTNIILHVGNTACFLGFVGLAGWAVSMNGGSNGPLMSLKTQMSSSEHGWNWIYGITMWYGSITQGIVNCCDYSRFAKTPRTPWIGAYFGNFVMGTIVPLLGIITVSAVKGVWGEEYWMPNQILEKALTETWTSKARAGAFFCAFGIFLGQIANNITGNGVCGGTDLAGFFPKYISIKRGSFIIALLSWAACPWTYFSSSSSYITVITSFSVFLCPLLGIYIAEYFIKRKRCLKLSDLYSYDKDGAYYYTGGINWKNMAAWIIGSFPGIPGLAAVSNTKIHISKGWYDFFFGNVFFGCAISMFLCIALNFIWKDKKEREIDEQDYFDTFTNAEANKMHIIPFSGIAIESVSSSEEKRINSDDGSKH